MRVRLFITGGSGFIGSPLMELALRAGHEVMNYDIAPPQRTDHRPYWYNGDVRDGHKLNAEMHRFSPTHVMHLASDIDVSLTNIEQFATTIDGTRNVLQAASELPLIRLLHTSTQFVVMPGIEPRNEHHLMPYTVYGEAKAEAEKLVWAANLPFPWLIVRPVIIWGPGHPSFADQIFKHIARRRYLHPTGEPINRAFGYVDNVASQMLGLSTMAAGLTNKHVFYVGDDTIDYDVWADAFSTQLTGKPARRVPVRVLRALGKVGDIAKRLGFPAPIDSGRAFRMSTSSRIDLSETHALINGPTVGFDEGVTATIAWLRQAYPSRFRFSARREMSE